MQEKGPVRLRKKELKIIKDTTKLFDKGARIFIFGSRADVNKKGGDIDILVISNNIDWRARRKIRVEFIKNLGERKIDFIVAKKEDLTKPFVRLAMEEGIEI